MEMMEIVLLIAGGIIFILSFFIPDKKNASGKDGSAEGVKALLEGELQGLISQEMNSIRTHVDDVVEEAVTYAMEKTERSLERLSNEKIMAVSEYSDTVLSEIHKNHEEAMFLYDMLNNKHTSLKNTVSEVNRTVKEAETAVMNFQKLAPETLSASEVRILDRAAELAVQREQGRSAQENSGIEQPGTGILGPEKPKTGRTKAGRPKTEKTVTEKNGIETGNEKTGIEKSGSKQSGTDNIGTENFGAENSGVQYAGTEDSTAAKGEVKKATKKGTRKGTKKGAGDGGTGVAGTGIAGTGIEDSGIQQERTEQPAPGSPGTPSEYAGFMQAVDGQGRNNNEKILGLFQQGRSAVAIAKELGLGVGEVKLVIDLFNDQ